MRIQLSSAQRCEVFIVLYTGLGFQVQLVLKVSLLEFIFSAGVPNFKLSIVHNFNLLQNVICEEKNITDQLHVLVILQMMAISNLFCQLTGAGNSIGDQQSQNYPGHYFRTMAALPPSSKARHQSEKCADPELENVVAQKTF